MPKTTTHLGTRRASAERRIMEMASARALSEGLSSFIIFATSHSTKQALRSDQDNHEKKNQTNEFAIRGSNRHPANGLSQTEDKARWKRADNASRAGKHNNHQRLERPCQ